MNIERERAAFEWWASDEGESPQATERVGGCYKLAQIQSYWMAWQARAARRDECEKLRKDAERYRWLRADNAYFPEENYIRGGQELDSAIDAVLAKATGGEEGEKDE